MAASNLEGGSGAFLKTSNLIFVEQFLEAQEEDTGAYLNEEDEEAYAPVCSSIHDLPAYSWERGYEKTWDFVSETATKRNGDELLSGTPYPNPRHQIDGAHKEKKPSFPLRRATLRHMVLLIDASDAMREEDYKPTRLGCTVSILKDFLSIFFRSNPLARLGIVVMLQGQAITLCPLSDAGDEQPNRLCDLQDSEIPGGSVSLLNGLERCKALLSRSPPYVIREVIVLFGSIKTCDSGDVHAGIEEIKACNIRVNVISLSPELHILRELTRITGGEYHVCRNLAEFRTAVLRSQKAPEWTSNLETRLVPMGFPKRLQTTTVSLCICHNRPSVRGYICPRCRCKVCEVSTLCRSCGLYIAVPSDIARTTQHFFPAPVSTPPQHISDSPCVMCGTMLPPSVGWSCPQCKELYCVACNLFRMTKLRQCPTCARKVELARRCLAV